MKSAVIGLLLSLAVIALAAAPEDQARAKGEAWLALLDSAQYGQSWTQSSALFRSHVDQSKWIQMIGDARKLFGGSTSRKFKSITFAKTMPGAPGGNYAVLTFDASFANKAAAVETLTMMDDAGEWRAAGYFIR